MKRIILLLTTLLLVFISTAHAQVHDHRNDSLNIATLFDPDDFVDPIALCKERYQHEPLIDCHEFLMGSRPGEEGRDVREERQHRVRLTQHYFIQKTEVTQLQWLTVMQGTKKLAPSSLKRRCDTASKATYLVQDHEGFARSITICKDHPVERISYRDITGKNGFLERLNASQSEYTYALPTEAQWEYAARGGEFQFDRDGNFYYPRFWFGDQAEDLGAHAFYQENSNGQTHPVAQKIANPYGLYDMYGNVWEMTSSYFDRFYGLDQKSLAGVSVDPAGPAVGISINLKGENRVFPASPVVKGGSWYNQAKFLRSASRRHNAYPRRRSPYVGLRLIRTPNAH